MNNYLIKKPSTFLDTIGLERIKNIMQQYSSYDIKTQAELYQLCVEVYNEHWGRLGKAICSNWADVQDEPFVAEKHNAIMEAMAMDLNILYTEYPKLLDILSDNYNYNSIANECLTNRVTDIITSIDTIPVPDIPKQMGHTHLVISDPLKNTSMLDDGATTATITSGEATLNLTGQPFDLTGLSRAFIVNPSRFYAQTEEEDTKPELITGIQGLQDQAEILEGLGDSIQSNGFPGSIHQGRYTYGVSSDAEGNTGMSSYISPVSGQDIHNDINTILDGKPSTWYEYELVNVRKEYLSQSPEIPFGDPHGYTFGKPYTYIRWAVGAQEGEHLNLVLHVKLTKQVPVNQVCVKLQNIKESVLPTINAIYCKSIDSKWMLVDKDPDVPIVATPTDQMIPPEPEPTPSTPPNLNDNWSVPGNIGPWVNGVWSPPPLTGGEGTTNTTNTTSGVGIQNPYVPSYVSTSSSSSVVYGGSTTPDVLVNVYGQSGAPGTTEYPAQVNESTAGPTGGAGIIHSGEFNVNPPCATVGDDVSDPTFKSYYDVSTTIIGEIAVDKQIDLANKAKSIDEENNETLFNYKFPNVWIKELLIILSQNKSYECDIIHKYHMRVWNIQKVTQKSETEGIINKTTTTTVETTNTKYAFREYGDNMSADIMFSGVLSGSSSSSSSTLAGIGNIISNVGIGIGLAGIGGPTAPILMGIGAFLSLFGGSSSTSTQENITSDQHISGYELIPGWRYAIGINDISLYSNNYATSSDIVSNTFNVPFDIRRIQISVTQLVPRTYPKGEWFKHYISIDGGTTWLSINPKNYPPSNSAYPSTILINPETGETRKIYNSQIINTDNVVNTIKYKCTISRPSDIPYQTPSLSSYSIYVEGAYEL